MTDFKEYCEKRLAELDFMMQHLKLLEDYQGANVVRCRWLELTYAYDVFKSNLNIEKVIK